jgi:hypothetical protein
LSKKTMIAYACVADDLAGVVGGIIKLTSPHAIRAPVGGNNIHRAMP